MNVRYFMKATRYTAVRANREGKGLFRVDRSDVDASSTAIEADVAVNQRENCVRATGPDGLSRQKFRAALPHNNISINDYVAAASSHPEPFSDAVALALHP